MQDRSVRVPAESSPVIGSDADVSDLLTGALHSMVEIVRGEVDDRVWQAFWMTAVDGRSSKDVALDLGITPGAVRTARSRVLRRLRAELLDFSEG